MVKDFQFARLPKINFRAGGITTLPSLVRSFGESVIIVTGKHSFISSEKAGRLFEELGGAGINFKNVIIKGEPSPEDIDRNVSLLNNERFDCVAGIGGGSVLDAGKAISAMMYMNRPIQDYLEGAGTQDHPGSKLPYIAVPTTSGTGSEATKNAVISRVGTNGFKRSLRHDNFVPDIALVDPELTLNCHEDITAASGMDCFTQLTEAYLSVKANEYTDALALEGLKAIKRSLLRSYRDGNDIEARSDMSFAALTSGICLANAGLGAVHGFASSLGGRYDIPHGLICGTLMAATNEANVRKLRTIPDSRSVLRKYQVLGTLFCGSKAGKEDSAAGCFIDFLNNLTLELHLPGLKEAGVMEEDLKDIASVTDCKNNPVKLESEELLEILKLRFK